MGRPSRPWFNKAKDAWYSTIDGELCRLAPGKANRRAAENEFHRLKAESEGRAKRGPAITVSALAEHFLDRCRRDLASVTYEGYRSHLRAFDRHFGRDVRAEDLRPKDILEWVHGQANWADATKADRVVAIKTVMRWGKRQGYIEANPLEDMQSPGRGRRRAIMTSDQADRLIEAVKDECFRDLIIMLRETGARPSEVMKLEASMIDFDRRIAVMESKTTRRTGKLRVILLGPKAIEICRRLAVKHPEGPMLRNRCGGPWRRAASSHRFRALRKKLGYGPEATAESFRHQFATDGLQKGIPIATLAVLMGHTGPTMIQRNYSHLEDRVGYLHESLEKMRPGDPGENEGGSPGRTEIDKKSDD